MHLKYGNYPFDAGGVEIASSAQTLWNEGGQRFEVRKRLDVNGYLTVTGQAAISLAMSALETALARPFQDLYFYHDDGSLSATALPNGSSIGGVKIVDGPHFPDSKGGEYSQFRHFNFAAEASYPVAGSANLLLSFSESLSFSGGGPLYVHRPALNTLPQKQLVYRATVFHALQEGRAVGYRKYPIAPRPIWPAALKQSPNQVLRSPRRRGKTRADYDSFETTWAYEFESAVQLVGVPNLWIG